MKKTFIFLFFSVLCLTTMKAQAVKFGVTGGFVNTSQRIEFSAFEDITEDASGFYLGGLLDLRIVERFHIQPEVTYANIDSNNFIYIPILLKYYIFKGLHLQLGPQINLVLDDIETLPTEDGSFNNFGLDAAFGIGFDITKNLFVEARYATEITNRQEETIVVFGDILENLDSNKFQTFTIGLGYKF